MVGVVGVGGLHCDKHATHFCNQHRREMVSRCHEWDTASRHTNTGFTNEKTVIAFVPRY